jgi:hypothetical protein
MTPGISKAQRKNLRTQLEALSRRKTIRWSLSDDAYWSNLIRRGGITQANPIFVGRRAALRELLQWLGRDTSGAIMYSVVGGPGTGKSVLLARIAALSDEAFREAAMVSQ